MLLNDQEIIEETTWKMKAIEANENQSRILDSVPRLMNTFVCEQFVSQTQGSAKILEDL